MSKVHAGMRKWTVRVNPYFLHIILKIDDFTKKSMLNPCVGHNESLGENLKDKTR